MSGILHGLLASFKSVSGFSLFSWGYDFQGQLGIGDRTSRSSPTQIGALTTWVTASAGGSWSGAITTDGELYMWGQNGAGELGLSDNIRRSSPTQVGALTNWRLVSCGNTYSYGNTIALKTDDTMWAWGQNNNPILGPTVSSSPHSSPIQIGIDEDWATVSMGVGSAAAISTDGGLYTWGNRGSGRLGDNVSSGTRNTPTRVGLLNNWASVAMGDSTCFSVKTDGTFWSWGSNSYGMLGTNENIQPGRSSPIQVGALTDWSSVGASKQGRAVGALRGNSLFTWGLNPYGQLGSNNVSIGQNGRSSPVQVSGSWAVISVGLRHMTAITTSNELFAWGLGTGGGLGTGNSISRSSPVQVSGSWSFVSTGGHNLAFPR